MIKFETKKIKPYGDQREVNAFIINEPHQDLNIIKVYTNIEDIEYFIEWLKDDVIDANITDFSFENGIEFQPFLFGSKKSKIAKIENNEFIGLQEFDTIDFLNVCYAWRDFLKSNISIT